MPDDAAVPCCSWGPVSLSLCSSSPSPLRLFQPHLCLLSWASGCKGRQSSSRTWSLTNSVRQPGRVFISSSTTLSIPQPVSRLPSLCWPLLSAQDNTVKRRLGMIPTQSPQFPQLPIRNNAAWLNSAVESKSLINIQGWKPISLG